MLKIDKINKVAKAPLDRSIVQQLEKAGEVLDYVSGTTITDMLTMAFGPTWSVQYPEHWIESYPQIETKKGPYKAPAVVIVKAVLSVPMFDPELNKEIIVTREGFGTATMKWKFEEMVLKTAQTDALKKAAYSFGLAGELARKPAEQAWFINKTAPWNSENLAAFANEWEIVRQYMKANNLTKVQLSYLISRMTNGEETDLTPQNIQQFISSVIQPMPATKQKKAG
jgi:hypothetical protein